MENIDILQKNHLNYLFEKEMKIEGKLYIQKSSLVSQIKTTGGNQVMKKNK